MAANDILIGLGNPIMSDDGIGLLVSGKVQDLIPDCDLELAPAGGFEVVDRMLGHRKAVIIDSMVTGKYPPGTVVRIDTDSHLETLRSGHSHGINFLEAIEVARSCDARLPDEVIVYGVEVEDPFSLGEQVSQTLKDRIDGIAREIADDLLSGR
ncbi:MAG: hydrogenase maturation protease [Candidatus Eisenbacteria bacterium]